MKEKRQFRLFIVNSDSSMYSHESATHAHAIWPLSTAKMKMHFYVLHAITLFTMRTALSLDTSDDLSMMYVLSSLTSVYLSIYLCLSLFLSISTCLCLFVSLSLSLEEG